MAAAERVDLVPTASIAPVERQLFNAIRQTRRGGVHARNLFPSRPRCGSRTTPRRFAREKVTAGADLAQQREKAISFAAYRVLHHRYATAVGGGVSSACFDAFMQKLGFDPQDTNVTGSSGLALGNRVGAAIIEAHRADGANEGANYADPSWAPVNPALVVDLPGAARRIDLAQAVTRTSSRRAGCRAHRRTGARCGRSLGALPADGGCSTWTPARRRSSTSGEAHGGRGDQDSAWLDPADPTGSI
jgi:hypothetical protein